MSRKMLLRIALVVVGVLLGIGIYKLSVVLVDRGSSTQSIIEDRKDEGGAKGEKSDLEEREEVETVRGTKLKKSGSEEDMVVQSVYDYFNDELPNSDVFSSDYELKETEDGEYCVNVGDWFVFCRVEYGVAYPYMVGKNSSLTEYEQKYIEDNGIEIDTSDSGVVSWYV